MDRYRDISFFVRSTRPDSQLVPTPETTPTVSESQALPISAQQLNQRPMMHCDQSPGCHRPSHCPRPWPRASRVRSLNVAKPGASAQREASRQAPSPGKCHATPTLARARLCAARGCNVANAEPKSQWHVLNGVADHGRVVPGRDGAERRGRREAGRGECSASRGV